MGKRLIAVTALITLAMVISACGRQTACYQDGNKRKPSIPFASVNAELPPLVSLVSLY
ncbi:hypothetical protein JF535_03610 [Microbulbifer salipaludis]|uniref:Lipoprotein n=1 Tax=Microbulbifer salipaludis TaxID=187980 RepID=A0ABS3E3Q1_9GAMM|nr:hypothetical protein [Microbulbifer salipaludis]MBN8429933.1 hypothetical protein [Microbulbifer salipaludis]